MTQTVEAVYDGTVLRPETALRLEPNTRVRLTVEVLPPAKAPPSRSSRTDRNDSVMQGSRLLTALSVAFLLTAATPIPQSAQAREIVGFSGNYSAGTVVVRTK